MTPQALVEADRLPLPPEHELSAEQRTAVERISAGPRGEVVGPFIPLLRSPEVMTRVQLLGEHLRFRSALDDDLVELTVLTVAREWSQQFEWGYHQPLALRAGLPDAVVADLAVRRRPGSGRPELAVVWDLVDELHRTREVSDEVYDAALAALGEQRVVEVVATTGYYTLLAMTMNAARTPPPAGAPRLPAGS